MAKLSPHQEAALRMLGLAGSVKCARSPQIWLGNEVATSTANWLERNGYAQRYWTGEDAGMLVITAKGRDAADALDPEDDEDEG